MQVTCERKTAESRIVVKLDFGPRQAAPKQGLQTTMPFFNHMLEQMIWRGEFNIEVKVELEDFYLTHVICEDVGIALGAALKKYVERNVANGLVGHGFALATIDEALAQSVVSFENRAYFDFSHPGITLPLQTENTNAEDLNAFLEGLVQGARCTLHLDLFKGKNGHHIWEAIFRSLGGALGQALQRREWRKGMTAGVAGPIQINIT